MDILIAVDVSKSMLVKDISPSRLNKVKSSIATLTRNCRKSFRAVLFSGSTLLICPLTSDHQSFEKAIRAAPSWDY